MNNYNKNCINNNNKQADKPFVIGLTGGIGSGKSAVLQILKALGAYIIDTDQVSKTVTKPGSECDLKLQAAFPHCVAGGVLQRALLKSYVFKNEDRRKLLNSVTHPYIFAETIKRAEGQSLVVAEVPLLFESGFDKLCDITVCVVASTLLRTARVNSRDNISNELIAAIMASQLTNEELIKKCDFVINNSGDLNELEKNVNDFFASIQPLIAAKNSSML